MRIEIVQLENGPDSHPDDGAAAGTETTGGSGKKGRRFVRVLKSSAILVVAVAALAVAAPRAWRFVRERRHALAEKTAAEEELYRRRVYAQRRLGGFRLKAPLFGPSDWNRTFSGEEAKRWKRIASAFENRRWAEAVPLLLGRQPPVATGKSGKGKQSAIRPFPSRDEIDRAREVLVAELDERGRTLSGIRSLVDGLHPSPTLVVSPSARPFVSEVEITGRGVSELRRDLERRDWLGLVNRLLKKECELFPPVMDVREPLREALRNVDPFLVCRGTATNADVSVVYLPEGWDETPRVISLRKRLADGTGWLVSWDLRIGEAFVVSAEMVSQFMAKHAELRAEEAKRLDDVSTRYRLGAVSEAEYARERAKRGLVSKTFLEWARSGKTEEEARKEVEESLEAAFAVLGRPNRLYVNGAFAETKPRFSLIGTKGRDWKRMLELHRNRNWDELVRLFVAVDGDELPSAASVRKVRESLASFRLGIKIETEKQSGVWAAELLPSDLSVWLKAKVGPAATARSIPSRFAEDAVELESHPDGDGVIAEFSVVRSELAVFSGSAKDFDKKLDELNDQWKKGVKGICRRIELTELDEHDVLDAAKKLADRLKRDLTAWLDDN